MTCLINSLLSSILANESCNRRLDSSNLTEHDDKIYCKSCYGKNFGPKGYGYGVGAGILGMNTEEKSVSSTSNVPLTAQVCVAPKKQASVIASNGASYSLAKAKSGGPDTCPRCNKTVYYAERMMGGGSVCIYLPFLSD